MDNLHQGDEDLSYGQVCGVIKDVNSEMRKEKKSYHGDHQPEMTEYLLDSNVWDTSMVVRVKKVEAEKILNSKGEKGSFLVRPSERTQGDYALAFRTANDIRHWRIVNKGGKFFVHPRPNPYNSLDDIISHFQEAVGQETGLTMVPLICDGGGEESTLKAGLRPAYSVEADSAEDVGVVGGGGTLKAPSIYMAGSDSNGTGTAGIATRPTRSMSRLNPANLTSWSVEDVCFWLVSQSLGNFVDTFKENEVDGECLLTLDNKLLKDDLGITALGHRSRILKRVETLKNEFQPN